MGGLFTSARRSIESSGEVGGGRNIRNLSERPSRVKAHRKADLDSCNVLPSA